MTQKQGERKSSRNIYYSLYKEKKAVGILIEQESYSYESEEVKKLKEWYALLEELEKQFLNKLRADKKFFNIVEKYFLLNCSATDTATVLNLTSSNVRKVISRTSQMLKQTYGESLGSVLEGRDTRQLKQLIMAQERGVVLEETLLTEFTLAMPQAEKMYGLSLADCERELRVMKLYARATMENQLVACDREKLSFLLGVLTGDGAYNAQKRSVLKAFLTGEMKDANGVEVGFTRVMEAIKSKGL